MKHRSMTNKEIEECLQKYHEYTPHFLWKMYVNQTKNNIPFKTFINVLYGAMIKTEDSIVIIKSTNVSQ